MLKILINSVSIYKLDLNIKNKCINTLDAWETVEEKEIYLDTLNYIFDEELNKLNSIIGKHSDLKYKVLSYMGKAHLFEVQNDLNTIRNCKLEGNLTHVRPNFIKLYS